MADAIRCDKAWFDCVGLCGGGWLGASWAQEENAERHRNSLSGAADDAGSLFELLELVRGGLVDESAANEARLEAFVESRDQQAELLAAAED